MKTKPTLSKTGKLTKRPQQRVVSRTDAQLLDALQELSWRIEIIYTWLWGRMQAVWPLGWYECSLCGHKVRLHRADMKIGCVKDGCHNIGLDLRRCKPPNATGERPETGVKP